MLAASCRLPKDAERQILILSDLSGPGGGDQFEPYLTGYPVESAGCYALARTWPAPEMDRPGCVWTHTLLIGMDLVANLEYPEILLSLFRRPNPETGFAEFLEAVPLPSTCELGGGVDEVLGAELIRALYSSASPYTVLPVERYSVAEPPFLSIWRLQWARLRQCFTFCTGVRSPRTLEGLTFHLQAALPRDVRRFDRGLIPPTVIEPSIGREYEEWVRVAVTAYIGLNTSLLGFICRVGRHLPGDSTLFRPVVQAFTLLNRDSEVDVVDELISFTAMEYPEPGSGSEYKRALLGYNLAGLSEPELIRGLATTECHQAYDANILGIRARAAALWSSEEKAWRLLVQLLTGSHNPLGEQAILGLTSGMPPTLLSTALDAPREVLTGIITRNPRLASSGHLWNSPANQSRASQALASCREQVAPESDAIIRTALESKADPAYPTLIDVFGPTSVASVLNWLDQDPQRQIPPGWRTALAGQSLEMLGWLQSRNVRPETAHFVITNLNLEMALASPLLPAALVRHLESTDDTSIVLAARVLQAALSMSSPGAVDLASATLDIVYHAAAVSRLPEGAWYGLSPLLPESYWWQGWDRCERLRKGIAEKFRTEEWPAPQLIGITQDDALFGAIVGELRNHRSGRRVLATAAKSGGPSARQEIMLSD